MLANQSITSIETVLDLAVWLEKHGQAFYERARDRSHDPALQKLFSDLAFEESKHCAIYTDLYQLYTGRSAEGEKLLGEYGKFIELLIREIAQDLEYEEALSQAGFIKRALQFEKNTLLYLNEVKPLFRGKAGSLIDAICREEKKHIQQLIERRELLRKPAANG